MIQVLLSGCGGRMGREVAKICEVSDCFEIAAGVDPVLPECAFPVYSTFNEVKEKIDVIIDFSFHTAITGLLAYAKKEKIPAVIATTAFTPEELAEIENASKEIPVFKSANMSIGVNLICELAQKAAKFLPDFDIEIVEKHHNQKVDAPSGTALMIADEIASVLPEKVEYVYDRHSVTQKRSKNEIGIHAIRGGTIVGEHEVIFAGHQEVVTITHTSYSREILANGAVCAAQYLVGKPAGMYNMKSMLNEA